MSSIYFIKPKNMDGPIKIGFSTAPLNRLDALMAWSPWPLEVIGTVPGAYAEELFLHRCFADFHSHKEWFFSAPELRSAIEAMIEAGSIDPVRKSMSPIKDIRRKGTVSAEARERMSYGQRIRRALESLREETPKCMIWYSEPDHVGEPIRKWSGQKIRPTLEELDLIEKFIADPVANGARRKVYERDSKLNAA
jgi:hypothetical protein